MNMTKKYACILQNTQVYDFINPENVWKATEELGVPAKLIRVIRARV